MKMYWTFFLLSAFLGTCQQPAAQSEASASLADCIDASKINPEGICTMDYNPVCGCDGKTYSNPCAATNAGVRTYAAGPCPEPKSK